MKIISVQFDYSNQDKYERLARVFEHSAKKNCPDADFELVKISPPKLTRVNNSKSFASNTVKLDIWLDRLKATDQDVIFLDCDMMILKDLHSVFDSDFDIGYTKRTSCRIPYNGGAVFVKNNPRSIAFIELWNDINKKMYKDKGFHYKWRNIYAGMNQAAFGYILEKEKYEADLKCLPCAEWNACVEDWQSIDQNTKIVHVKGGLRRAVLLQAPGNTIRWLRAFTLWNNLAIECGLLAGRIQTLSPIERKTHPLISKVKGIRRRRRK